MKLPCLLQPRILKLALTSLFSRPFTTKFPAEPFEPIKEFRGRPRFHEKECIGCGACAEVCPPKCIDVVDDAKASPPVRRLTQHLDACIECGQCERYCTTKEGIKLTNEWDFVGFKPEDFEERVQKQLLLCEACGCVLAPVDQIRWIAKRLGQLAFCNPTLMLVAHGEMAVVDKGVGVNPQEIQRGNHLNIQCPKCRRKTAFAV